MACDQVPHRDKMEEAPDTSAALFTADSNRPNQQLATCHFTDQTALINYRGTVPFGTQISPFLSKRIEKKKFNRPATSPDYTLRGR